MHLCVIATNTVGERWNSMADAILTKRRKGLSPVMFDDIMCLKWNKRLWGLADVVEANKRRKNSSKATRKRLKAHRSLVQARKKEIIEWDGFYDSLDACLDAEKEAPNKDDVDNADSDDDESMKESAIDLSGSLSLADDSEDSDSD